MSEMNGDVGYRDAPMRAEREYHHTTGALDASGQIMANAERLRDVILALRKDAYMLAEQLNPVLKPSEPTRDTENENRLKPMQEGSVLAEEFTNAVLHVQEIRGILSSIAARVDL